MYVPDLHFSWVCRRQVAYACSFLCYNNELEDASLIKRAGKAPFAPATQHCTQYKTAITKLQYEEQLMLSGNALVLVSHCPCGTVSALQTWRVGVGVVPSHPFTLRLKARLRHGETLGWRLANRYLALCRACLVLQARHGMADGLRHAPSPLSALAVGAAHMQGMGTRTKSTAHKECRSRIMELRHAHSSVTTHVQSGGCGVLRPVDAVWLDGRLARRHVAANEPRVRQQLLAPAARHSHTWLQLCKLYN